MNITKHIVTSSNWDTGRDGNPITGIVLHTMVGTTAGAQSRFNDPASQVSVHYGVSLDGSIHQWVEEADTAWQAGNYPINQTTIGIEHEDNGNYNDSTRTPAEYASSSDLVASICKRYKIPCDTNHIFLHKNVIDKSKYPGGTACPDGLDTNKIISMAAAKIGNTMSTIATNDIVDSLAHAYLNDDIAHNPGLKAYVGQPVEAVIVAFNGAPERGAYLKQIQAWQTQAQNSQVNKTSVEAYIQAHLT